MSSVQRGLGILGALGAGSVEIAGLRVPGTAVEKTLQKYCKQIFRLTGDDRFPYQFPGSATALQIGGRYFIFCCGHQIDEFEPGQIAIYHNGKTITGSVLIKPTVTETNSDSDWIDVRAMEYKIENYNVPNLSHHFFRVTKGRNSWPTNDLGNFIIYGFPSERQNIDYEIPHITARATQVVGRYDGASSSPYVHRLSMDRKEIFNSDGMSGGAVFYLGRAAALDYFVGLACLITRGSATSDVLHFIEVEFLMRMIEGSK